MGEIGPRGIRPSGGVSGGVRGGGPCAYNTVVFLLEGNDGLTAAACMHWTGFQFAAKLRSKPAPVATDYLNKTRLVP